MMELIIFYSGFSLYASLDGGLVELEDNQFSFHLSLIVTGASVLSPFSVASVFQST